MNVPKNTEQQTLKCHMARPKNYLSILKREEKGNKRKQDQQLRGQEEGKQKREGGGEEGGLLGEGVMPSRAQRAASGQSCIRQRHCQGRAGLGTDRVRESVPQLLP